jgi:hypothetical protein
MQDLDAALSGSLVFEDVARLGGIVGGGSGTEIEDGPGRGVPWPGQELRRR